MHGVGTRCRVTFHPWALPDSPCTKTYGWTLSVGDVHKVSIRRPGVVFTLVTPVTWGPGAEMGTTPALGHGLQGLQGQTVVAGWGR